MSTVTDKVANALYLSGCLKFGSFKIKSGATSPYYIDLARVLSAPKQLCTIAEAASEKIRQIMTNDKIDKLASIELKGALIVPSIACNLNLPCIIVRKEEKAYGVTGRIAGADVNKGDKILFFDDVISEGISKVEGIKPLQELVPTLSNAGCGKPGAWRQRKTGKTRLSSSCFSKNLRHRRLTLHGKPYF